MTALAVLAMTVLGLSFTHQRQLEKQANLPLRELSANGIYAFFHAFRNNELDYERYYPKREHAWVNQKIGELLVEPPATRPTLVAGANPIARSVAAAPSRRALNVVLISVESLSADFLGIFGNSQQLTPELDALSKQGLLFSNLYATGTRTVRGLEALSIAMPPTPGQSIVRRPKNSDLATLGGALLKVGYQSYFVYGGYGYFDNMNAYFAGNHYKVVDRTDASAEQLTVHHENVWGIADEDLYTLAMNQFDREHASKKPFFAHLMTTSNHRPFTFPNNRVPAPQKSRDGAVQYTDWAIGDFIRRAKTKPWFNDTLFIITADHTAGGAGKTDLPVKRYHIPMIWYAPAHLPASEQPRLMSQIDIAPSLLGWLGVPYQSRFFGYDIFKLAAGRERAFIGTYQTVGYLKDNRLTTLKINSKPKVEPATAYRPIHAAGLSDAELADEAIAWYQSASMAYNNGHLVAAP